MTPAEIAARIQHTNVKPDATAADIERLCAECLEHEFDGAMVNPIWVPLATERLRGSRVKVCTALDFPMGGGTIDSVAAAAAESAVLGAAQIDVMTKPGWLKSAMDDRYRAHLTAVVSAAGVPVKAMLEVAQLTDDELDRAVEHCVAAGIDYIKNSSGYGGGDATAAVVTRLKGLASGRVEVKASGGIRSLEAALSLLEAGATLLGASRSVEIVTGKTATGGY